MYMGTVQLSEMYMYKPNVLNLSFPPYYIAIGMALLCSRLNALCYSHLIALWKFH